MSKLTLKEFFDKADCGFFELINQPFWDGAISDQTLDLCMINLVGRDLLISKFLEDCITASGNINPVMLEIYANEVYKMHKHEWEKIFDALVESTYDWLDSEFSVKSKSRTYKMDKNTSESESDTGNNSESDSTNKIQSNSRTQSYGKTETQTDTFGHIVNNQSTNSERTEHSETDNVYGYNSNVPAPADGNVAVDGTSSSSTDLETNSGSDTSSTTNGGSDTTTENNSESVSKNNVLTTSLNKILQRGGYDLDTETESITYHGRKVSAMELLKDELNIRLNNNFISIVIRGCLKELTIGIY